MCTTGISSTWGRGNEICSSPASNRIVRASNFSLQVQNRFPVCKEALARYVAEVVVLVTSLGAKRTEFNAGKRARDHLPHSAWNIVLLFL